MSNKYSSYLQKQMFIKIGSIFKLNNVIAVLTTCLPIKFIYSNVCFINFVSLGK